MRPIKSTLRRLAHVFLALLEQLAALNQAPFQELFRTLQVKLTDSRALARGARRNRRRPLPRPLPRKARDGAILKGHRVAFDERYVLRRWAGLGRPFRA
ncbi:MAG: hypothetical protein HC901_00410 [Bdellovibrionaceae bacterium]|nr:hypothetical protein [Pseudobdellovibrionaceae bacterium]